MYFLLEKRGQWGEISKVSDVVPREVETVFPEAMEIHGCFALQSGKELCCVIQVPIREEAPKKSKVNTVPLLGQGHTFWKIAFVIRKDAIWAKDYDGIFEKKMPEFTEEIQEKTPEQILYRLFCKLVEKDAMVLDIIYKQLATLEGEIPRDNARFFLQKMYTMKHSIYQLFRYYHQLTEMAEELMESDGEFLEVEQMQCFERFVERTKRLSDDMEIMREYAMEIWEIYQSQINIRQNDIMKVLTIVTTIFLPLSLLVGWYGMNFEYMPEVSWKYGYLMVILFAIAIVVFSLVLFRRKKYW
ncbi:MAG: CorA family divalent cation transporter [Lachnospiraceae bacterium]|nr:hypothetical protein [Lachnospiraceae bacterium]MDD6191475.1 CorA family divalent cation transporter [Lachnospiraceae bacterium]MDY4792977.1 CorA family divalent cation transporter [Pararoseburia sp.]